MTTDAMGRSRQASSAAHRASRVRQPRFAYFTLEAVNSFATGFFLYYLYFYMREFFGFGNAGNLFLTALHGFVYIFASFLGGRFAQKFGYCVALRAGFGVMALALSVGGLLPVLLGFSHATLVSEFLVILVWTTGMCFTWPALEALVSDHEQPAALPRLIGIYNVTWAGSAALAYFTGGALVEKLGWQTVFWLPVGLHLIQYAAVVWLERRPATPEPTPPVSPAPPETVTSLNHRPIAKAKTFLRLAWTANPFAYIAINALLPVIPKLADQLDLSPMYAGFLCSIWFFARLAAFGLLWFWPGWHYKFRYLIGAYVAMVLCFALMLLMRNFAALVLGQIIFGLALGLIYYSSLFYSMDVGETKGEHGGIHEAAIGVGVFAGPAIGVTALQFSSHAHAGTLAVSGLLLAGLAALVWLHARK